MKKTAALSLALMLLCAGGVRAADLQSGPQVGDSLGAFEVTKVAGAPHDGVAEGKELCYRCRMGDRPVVMVFARHANDQLSSLLKQLDKVVADNQDKKMASFVNLLGSDPDDLKKSAKDLASKDNLEHVAVVVPEEHAAGPATYHISPDADVTVLVYRDGKVEANHAIAAGDLSEKQIARIVADTSKILK